MNDDEKYGDGAIGGLSLEDRKRQKQEEMDRQYIQQHCGLFREFLGNLRERGINDMCPESSEVVTEMMKDMVVFTESPNMRGTSNALLPTGTSNDIFPTGIVHNDRQGYASSVNGESEKSDIVENPSDADNRPTNHGTSPNIASAANVLNTNSPIIIDNRQVPKMEKYKDDSGQDLIRYLNKFENYCRDTYKGSQDLWLNELECLLSGETLNNFLVFRDQHDGYRSVINKLTRWYQGTEERRMERYRKKFENARPTKGESLFMFSMKLEHSFTLAYPRKDFKNSEALKQQFLNVIPNHIKYVIKGIILKQKIEKKIVDWEFVQTCAKEIDALEETDSGESTNEHNGRKEVIINLSQQNGYYKNTNRTGVQQNQHQQNGRTFDRSQSRNRFGNRETSRNGYNAFRDTTGNRPRVPMCYYCKRFGHMASDCRVLLGKCLLCGLNGHFVDKCPQNNRARTENAPNDRYQRGRSTARNNQGNHNRHYSNKRSRSYDHYGRNYHNNRQQSSFDNQNREENRSNNGRRNFVEEYRNEDDNRHSIESRRVNEDKREDMDRTEDNRNKQDISSSNW